MCVVFVFFVRSLSFHANVSETYVTSDCCRQLAFLVRQPVFGACLKLQRLAWRFALTSKMCAEEGSRVKKVLFFQAWELLRNIAHFTDEGHPLYAAALLPVIHLAIWRVAGYYFAWVT